MKKFAICLLILAVVCTSAFASVLQVGATARYGGSITSLDDYKKVSNYDFGADARINLGLFGVAANVLFGKSDGDNLVLNSILTANLRLDFKAVDIAVGAGYALPFEFASDGVLINNKPANEVLDVIKNSQLLIRGAVGFNVGILGISVDYKIPYYTLVDYIKGEDKSNFSSFEKGNIAISVLANLF